jgi:hypothetical protein
MTSSLSDLDHKVLIVMNKCDEFTSVEDFARCYGSLCWNLSKVIPRKDLPRIYTMFLPTVNTDNPDPDGVGAIPMQTFIDTREEVIREIYRAPLRRVDNSITELNDTGNLLATSWVNPLVAHRSNFVCASLLAQKFTYLPPFVQHGDFRCTHWLLTQHEKISARRACNGEQVA